MSRIYTFPYGGGSAASYRLYAKRFPDTAGQIVPVEIPGHGKRVDEPFAASIEECASQTLDQLDMSDGDYVLHGHCMGALIAFETVKQIEANGGRPPRFLVASGRNAPGHANAWLDEVQGQDDRALFDRLQAFGGIPQGLSFAMAQPFLEVIRQDQAMFANYRPDATQVHVPILALAGGDDEMTDPSELARWNDYTTEFVSVEWLEGGHYFLLERPEDVAALIAEFAMLADAAMLVEGR